jgi:hypothetical protein
MMTKDQFEKQSLLMKVMSNVEIKQFVVMNYKEGVTRLNSNQNSKKRNFDTNKYIKRVGFLS